MIAIDQHGTRFNVDPKRPRACLLDQLGRKHASRMFQDRKGGPPVHIGYVIAGHWLTLYSRWEQPV